MTIDEQGFVPLFNGHDLTGWFPTPRSYGELWPGGPTIDEVAPGLFPDDYNEQAAQHAAVWTVEDGAIVGRQDAPGSGWGGYLVSEETYGDFELIARGEPRLAGRHRDLPAQAPDTFHGIQVLLDHRKSGSIAGFFGNGIGGFHAVPFALDARYDDDRQRRSAWVRTIRRPRSSGSTSANARCSPTRRRSRSSSTCGTGSTGTSSGSASSAPSRSSPSWVNGLKIAELDMATLVAPHYDADAVAALLGPAGHIALRGPRQRPDPR